MHHDPRSALVGTSSFIQRLRSLLPCLSASDSGILIVGEPGTGREQVARLIHEQSPRRDGPFAVMGCPACDDHEEFSELFGGGQGGPGLLESCAEGSVYLASVDELPPPSQTRLARHVEDVSYGTVARAPRLIASARHDLARRVEQGRFRGDLYYKLSVVTLRLPPLRERREDIPMLALHFLEEAGRLVGKRFEGIGEEALAALHGHRWNGNLVELASAMQRAAIVETSDWLGVESLPPGVAHAPRLSVAS